VAVGLSTPAPLVGRLHTPSAASRTAAVIGAGWAGLAAAVGLTQAGLSVTVFEMAPVLGGRARTVVSARHRGDNGQHILIGAYRASLDLMRQVGVAPEEVLLRAPLSLQDAHGRGLRLTDGNAALAFARAVLGLRAWPLTERLALLSRCAAWAAMGFRCDPALSVERLCSGLSPALRTELLEPLCVAALNTPAHEASASVFLRVIRDALIGGPGCADLLLPRVPLGSLLPDAAAHWLESRGAQVIRRARVQALDRRDAGWAVDGRAFDTVVVACTASEAARLARPHAPDWASLADGLRHQSILTTYVQCDDARFRHHPMARLDSGPAQFAFDHGWLSGTPGMFAFVASAADSWMTNGLADAEAAVLAQAQALFRTCGAHGSPRVAHSVCERKATFACTTRLRRPPARIAHALWAAADYVAGPYPATLEGAVRNGVAAARGAAYPDADSARPSRTFAMQNRVSPSDMD
jgi:squalene-associated FAD-dependent desaturase